METPDEIKKYLKQIGALGGRAGTDAQRAARAKNIRTNPGRKIDPNSKRQQMLRAKALKDEQAAAMQPETGAEVSP